MGEFDTVRQRQMSRLGALRNERASWVEHWQDVSRFVLPRNGRFFLDDRNRGNKRHNNILDSTATRALRTLAAGMLAGMTSPARPWFRLTIKDTDLAKFHPVKVWLDDVSSLMLHVFARSNTYRVLHGLYEELGVFGTAGSIVVEDFKTVIRHYPMTCGEYCMATDFEGRVNTVYREFQRPVHEIVAHFGLENCSPTVRNLYARGSLQSWIPIVHVIEPRADADRDLRKRDARNMAFRSCYFEAGADPTRYLRESGYQEFPGIMPRWHVAGGDIYGHSPAMEALGDVRQLQQEQMRKGQGIDYQTQPPLQVPTSLKSQEVERLPGGITYIDSPGQQQAIKSLWDVNLNLEHLLADIGDVRQRINSAFSADMFLMLANSDRSQMTAYEVAEKHEEKLLMLGPVLERLHDEMAEPFIERTFSRLVEANVLPPLPQELSDHEIDIEFVSMLAQAQRAVGVTSIDRFVGTVGQIATMKPEVLDKIDGDFLIDEYADRLGVSPRLLVAGEQVALIREARAKVEQEQAAQQAANLQADTANKMAAAKTGDKSALTDLLNQFSGYNSPSAVELQ